MKRIIAFYLGLDAEKRKLFWFGLAVAMAVLFVMAPSPASLMQRVTHLGRRDTRPQIVKRSAFGGPAPVSVRALAAPAPPMPVLPQVMAQAAPAASVVAPAASLPAVTPVATSPHIPFTLLGFFRGAAELPPNRGLCTMQIEIREEAETHLALGYSSMACGPSVASMLGGGSKKINPMQLMFMQHGLSPTGAILHGTFEKDGSLHFAADKTIDVSQGRACLLAAATVVPFGTDKIGMDFKEHNAAGCAGGQMLLSRFRP